MLSTAKFNFIEALAHAGIEFIGKQHSGDHKIFID